MKAMNTQHQHVVDAITAHANVATYAGAATSLVFWGLHVNEICAIISTAVAVAGLCLQIYSAIQRRRRRTFH